MTWLDGQPAGWHRNPISRAGGIQRLEIVGNIAWLLARAPERRDKRRILYAYDLSQTPGDAEQQSAATAAATPNLGFPLSTTVHHAVFRNDARAVAVQMLNADQAELTIHRWEADGTLSEIKKLNIASERRPQPGEHAAPSALGDWVAWLSGQRLFEPQAGLQEVATSDNTCQRVELWNWRTGESRRIPVSWDDAVRIREKPPPPPETADPTVPERERTPLAINSVSLLPGQRVLVSGKVCGNGTNADYPSATVLKLYKWDESGVERVCSHCVPCDWEAPGIDDFLTGCISPQAASTADANEDPLLAGVTMRTPEDELRQVVVRLQDLAQTAPATPYDFRVQHPAGGATDHPGDSLDGQFTQSHRVPGISGERVVTCRSDPDSDPANPRVTAIALCDYSRASVERVRAMLARGDAPAGARIHLATQQPPQGTQELLDYMPVLDPEAPPGLSQSQASTATPHHLDHVQTRVQLPQDLPEGFETRMVAIFEGGLLLIGQDSSIVLQFEDSA